MSICCYCMCACSNLVDFPWFCDSNEEECFSLQLNLCQFCHEIALESLGGGANPTFGNTPSEAYIYIFPNPLETEQTLNHSIHFISTDELYTDDEEWYLDEEDDLFTDE